MKANILRDISQSNPVSDSPPIQNLGSSQATEKISSVPPAATVTSKSEKLQAFRDRWIKVKDNILKNISQSNPVSNSPPIQNLGSEILDRIAASGSISVTKVSTGSLIDKSSSQSPVLDEAPEEEILTNKTTFIHAMPPVNKNPTPKMLSKPLPLDLSQGKDWQQILDF